MGSMKVYIIKRSIQLILVIFFVLFLNFIIINAAPGNPAQLMAGEYSTEEYIKAIEARWGLDKPIHIRFLIYMKNLLHGDLGYSYRYLEPVSKLIMERIGKTLLLTVPSIILAFLVGVWLARIAARKPGGKLDVSLSIITLIFYSMPSFWLGLLLILVFGVKLGILPIAGMTNIRAVYSSSWDKAFDILKHMVLPVTTLMLIQIPAYFRITRGAIIEQSTEDYVKTFDAVGFSKKHIFNKYIFRNAILPPVTILGLRLGYAFSGAALVEIVFGWPGMGRLLLDAAFARDYPLIMGIYLVIAVSVAVAIFITDLLYAVLDPRIRY
ncbi:ABC transporter permease [Pyrococcus horikoshii]|nr:ABC transporter permease [Pyrococcus horikoshii]BAA29901.1 323aa long hypothetical oligopeptide transport permease protein APPB [Pyrococcus horikoshii OT3]